MPSGPKRGGEGLHAPWLRKKLHILQHDIPPKRCSTHKMRTESNRFHQENETLYSLDWVFLHSQPLHFPPLCRTDLAQRILHDPIEISRLVWEVFYVCLWPGVQWVTEHGSSTVVCGDPWCSAVQCSAGGIGRSCWKMQASGSGTGRNLGTSALCSGTLFWVKVV